MSCRDHHYQLCHCYDYTCPGPPGDKRGCGFRYFYGYDEENDETFAHWTEPGEPCINCPCTIPDIGCTPKITKTNPQKELFNAR